MRALTTAIALSTLVGLGTTPSARAEDWGTVKGQVVFDGAAIPARAPVDVNKDQAHCLAKGKILDEKWVVNPKNKGVRDTFVWLVPATGGALPIHPDLQKPKEDKVEMDQPCCAFEPHALILRKGQTLVVKNSAPIVHNVKWFGGRNNPGGNVILPPNSNKEISDLAPSNLPVFIDCNIHPWMRALVRVFDHPYAAVTDADGTFTIPKAPAGKYNLVTWHDAVGWGPGLKAGTPITIKADGTTDLGAIKIKPAD